MTMTHVTITMTKLADEGGIEVMHSLTVNVGALNDVDAAQLARTAVEDYGACLSNSPVTTIDEFQRVWPVVAKAIDGVL